MARLTRDRLLDRPLPSPQPLGKLQSIGPAPSNSLSSRPVTLLAGMIGVAISVATLSGSTFGIFANSLGPALGWSRPQIMAGIALQMLTIVGSAPIMGMLMDRGHGRAMALTAVLLHALGLFLLGSVPLGLPLFYLIMIGFGIVAPACSFVYFTRIITSLYDRGRGAALGIVLAGSGVGGAALPLIANQAILTSGWQAAYRLLAALVLLLGLPSVLVLGSGTTCQERVEDAPARISHWLRRPDFLMLAGSMMLLGFAGSGLLLNLVPTGRGLGLSATQAATLQATAGITAIIGRVGGGWALDRTTVLRVAAIAVVAMVVSGLLFASAAPGLELALCSAALLGIGVGVETDIATYAIGRLFGQRLFGRLASWMMALTLIGSAMGPFVFTLVERASSQQGAAMVMTVVLVTGLVPLLLLDRVRRRPAHSG